MDIKWAPGVKPEVDEYSDLSAMIDKHIFRRLEASMRIRDTDWSCPLCGRPGHTRHLFDESSTPIIRPPICIGIGHHPPTSMTALGFTEIDTKENTMTHTPPVFPTFPATHPWVSVLNQFGAQIDTAARQHREAVEGRLPENQFRALDVREGDRIRLTVKAAPDASQLEGVVVGIKVKDGKSQVRIKGFGHTGGKAGGQHVWFPVENYTIEVLHRAYRWTPDDEIIVEIMGLDRKTWEKLSEDSRESHRRHKAQRIEKIKAVLAAVAKE